MGESFARGGSRGVTEFLDYAFKAVVALVIVLIFALQD